MRPNALPVAMLLLVPLLGVAHAAEPVPRHDRAKVVRHHIHVDHVRTTRNVYVDLRDGPTVRPRLEYVVPGHEGAPAGGADPFVRRQQTYVYKTSEGWVWIGDAPRTPAPDPNYVSRAWATYRSWAPF